MVPLFYRFMQLELFICTSTSIFKHFLYTNMPYICNAKIGCNFIILSFQHTQLQYFSPEIPQQRAGYSTSLFDERDNSQLPTEGAALVGRNSVSARRVPLSRSSPAAAVSYLLSPPRRNFAGSPSVGMAPAGAGAGLAKTRPQANPRGWAKPACR